MSLNLTPDQGTKLGKALYAIGCLLLVVCLFTIRSNLIVALILFVIAAPIAGLGWLVQDVSKEVDYERDVLD